jgi:metal-dependent amidase/aminoacylase/carboxypeptidase family protein
MARATEKDVKAQKARYLKAVARAGTLTAGCKAARVSPNTVYAWREHDTEFSITEQQMRNALADALEEEAIRRAWRGVNKPVFQGGTLVGHVREFSDTLLIFMLKAVRPEKYRERFDVTSAGEPIIKAYPGVELDRV